MKPSFERRIRHACRVKMGYGKSTFKGKKPSSSLTLRWDVFRGPHRSRSGRDKDSSGDKGLYELPKGKSLDARVERARTGGDPSETLRHEGALRHRLGGGGSRQKAPVQGGKRLSLGMAQKRRLSDQKGEIS